MTGTSDIAIVGAGIVGCAIARELASRGVGCAVFDDRPIAGGATQASAGMLAPHVEAHEAGPLLDLGTRSLALYDAWIDAVRAESGEDVEFRRIGTLEVAIEEDKARALERAASRAPAGRAYLSGADLRAAHPAIGPAAGALFTPWHGYAAAADLSRALARAAQQRGTTFHRTCVRAIECSNGLARLTTGVGVHECSAVIVAAGAWTNSIGGIDLPPLRPVRGQILHLGWHGHPLSTIVWGPDCYVVPRADGTMLVGATVEEAGFDERNTAAGIRDLLDAVCELLPESWGATFLDARAGLRPATPDDLPVIGPDPRQPLVVHASGHYRNGVLLAPITAQLIGDWIVDRRRDAAFDVFRANRF